MDSFDLALGAVVAAIIITTQLVKFLMDRYLSGAWVEYVKPVLPVLIGAVWGLAYSPEQGQYLQIVVGGLLGTAASTAYHTTERIGRTVRRRRRERHDHVSPRNRDDSHEESD